MLMSSWSRSRCCSGVGVATRRSRLSAVGGRQDDVRALQRRELREGSGRCEAGATAVQQVFQRHPARVAEKGDQEMGFHAVLQLMEERSDGQLAFQRPEGGFRFGQLDVLRPELLGRLSLKIRAQHIRALARGAPGAPRQARRASINRQASRSRPRSSRTPISSRSATMGSRAGRRPSARSILARSARRPVATRCASRCRASSSRVETRRRRARSFSRRAIERHST
jgi:hypothetical protein